MPREETKQRITQAAVRLFNEHGTAAVSTNHIANAAGISPGNLYYHFRNKEEIIRAVFERMNGAWARINGPPMDDASSPADLRRILDETFSLLYDYRFFYRESVALTRRDPELGRRYRQVREAGLTNTEILLSNFGAGNFMREPNPPATLPGLAGVIWLITEFWLPFAELGNESIGPERLREGVDFLVQVLRPYLTEDAVSALGSRCAGISGHEAKS